MLGTPWIRPLACDLLSAKWRPVRRVIAVEREPSDASWTELCEAAGVTLVWPATFDMLFDASTT
jgi:hypothetical protein